MAHNAPYLQFKTHFLEFVWLQNKIAKRHQRIQNKHINKFTMNHSHIAHCPGVSSPIAVMVGMDEALCRSCLRHEAHLEAEKLGIREQVPYITPRLLNGCSYYKEVEYVEFNEI